MDELDLDFSDITWEAESTWTDSWVEMDFSEIEESTETKPEETSKEETTEEPSTEQESWTEEVTTEEKPEETTEETTEKKSEETTSETEVDEIEELLKSIETGSEESEETIEKTEESLSKLGTEEEVWETSELLDQIKMDNSQLKTQVDQLQKLVWKINKEKWDIMMRNTELELYWNIDEPNLIYLNGNLEKAKWGDEKSKKRIVGILDDLRSELTGQTKEEQDTDNASDLISKVSSFNSSSNPNTKWGQGWIDDYEINL